MRHSLFLCVTCLWLVAATDVRAEVTLDIDPNPILANASCQLTFRVSDVDPAEPDFSPLEQDFDILRRNRQTSLSWVNGRSQHHTTWVLEVMPRRTGTIDIPALAFGRLQSPARQVEVVAAAPGPQAAQADLRLEVEAEPRTPYVQQQVIYTVRLLRRVELSNPRFSALETSSDAIVKPLGDGRQFLQQIDGVSYEVFEQRYAIFPQRSGTLTIDPLVLTTQVVSGKRSLFDPFAQSLQTRRVQSQAVELDVKPVPATFPTGATWLPARRLRLHEEWEPDSTQAETGAPLSRTVFLWADGLVAGQLPEVRPPVPDGIKLYPDQAQNNEQATASGFTAVLQQKFALIGSTARRADFAAFSLPWWNTETDELEVAMLSERSIEFVDGSATSPADPSALPAVDAGADTTPAASEVPATGRDETYPWPWLSAALACGWLLTLLAWLRARGRGVAAPTPEAPASDGRHTASASRARSLLKSACAGHDAEQARSALLDWSRALTSAQPCRSLRDVQQVAQSDALRTAIAALDRALYGGHRHAWRGDALWQAFEQEPPAPRQPPPKLSPTPLPPLFRLGSR